MVNHSAADIALDKGVHDMLCSNIGARACHQVVIHCAADIALDKDIQDTLRVNFRGTAEVLTLAATLPKMEVTLLAVHTYSGVSGFWYSESAAPLCDFLW